MRNTFLLTLLSLLLPVAIQAANIEWKSGYIVTLENDTIRGQIGKRDNGQDHLTCMFKSIDSGKIDYYSPQELLFYGSNDGLLYSSLNIETVTLQGQYFVQFLFEGIISLYYIELQDKSIYTYVLERKDTGNTFFIKGFDKTQSRDILRKRMKNTLNLFLGDCPEVEEDINKMRGTRLELISLLEKYHHIICKDDSCIIYLEKKPKQTHSLEIYAGMWSNPLSFNNGFKVIKSSRISPSIGVDYSFPLDPFSKKWLLHAGLEFSYINWESDDKVLRRNSFHFSAVRINNNLIVEYRNLSSSFLHPSILVGFHQELVMASKNDYRESDIKYNKYRFGVLAGIGVSIPLKNDYAIPLRFTYRHPVYGSNKYKNEFIIMDASDVFSLTVGYRFNL